MSDGKKNPHGTTLAMEMEPGKWTEVGELSGPIDPVSSFVGSSEPITFVLDYRSPTYLLCCNCRQNPPTYRNFLPRLCLACFTSLIYRLRHSPLTNFPTN